MHCFSAQPVAANKNRLHVIPRRIPRLPLSVRITVYHSGRAVGLLSCACSSRRGALACCFDSTCPHIQQSFGRACIGLCNRFLLVPRLYSVVGRVLIRGFTPPVPFYSHVWETWSVLDVCPLASLQSAHPVGRPLSSLAYGIGRAVAGVNLSVVSPSGRSNNATVCRSCAWRVPVVCCCLHRRHGDGGLYSTLLAACSVRRGIVAPPSNYLRPRLSLHVRYADGRAVGRVVRSVGRYLLGWCITAPVDGAMVA